MLNIDSDLYVILLLIFYLAAIYRMAIMISIDNGPLGFFEWVRSWIAEQVHKGYLVQKKKSLYFFENLQEGVNCTDCTGVWAAIILGVILIISLYHNSVGIIIFILGGAGFQHYITNQNNDTE